MDYSFASFSHFASPTGPWTDDLTLAGAEEAPLLYSDEIVQSSAEGDNTEVIGGDSSISHIPYFQQHRRMWAHGTTNDRQRLHHQRRLSQSLRHSAVSLPETAGRAGQHLLDAVLEFKPHQMGIGLVIDEAREAGLVLTAYWPTGTLHVEHFLHFPADDPDDTVVNFYAEPVDQNAASQRQWGWHCPAQELSSRLRTQLRNGQWPLESGW